MRPWLAAEPRAGSACQRRAAAGSWRRRPTAPASSSRHHATRRSRPGDDEGAVHAPAEMAGLRVRVTPNLSSSTVCDAWFTDPRRWLTDAQAAFGGHARWREAAPSPLAATRIAAIGQSYVTRWGGSPT